MKKVIFMVLMLSSLVVAAQKYTADKSTVIFFSKATIEDITAKNSKSVSIFNKDTGEIAFAIPSKEFEFAKSLMKEHFNEKYMETEKFPKSTFQGTITGFQANASGEQSAKATGKLTIHGKTKDIDVPGTIEFKDNQVFIKSKFMVKLEDYDVMRPQLLWKNIAEEVEVTIDFTYKPYEKK